MNRKIFGKQVAALFVLLLVFCCFVEANAQKMAPEEIIAKHIASIGKSDLVANSKLRIAVGGVEFLIPSAGKKANGRAALASNGTDLAFFSTFNMRDYRQERIGLFTNKINIQRCWITIIDNSIFPNVNSKMLF